MTYVDPRRGKRGWGTRRMEGLTKMRDHLIEKEKHTRVNVS